MENFKLELKVLRNSFRVFLILTLCVVCASAAMSSPPIPQDNTVEYRSDTAQYELTSDRVYEDAKDGVETIYSDVKSALSQVAKGLEQPVEHVYKLIVKQQILVAIQWLSICSIFLIISIMSFYSCGENKDNWFDSNQKDVLLPVAVIALMIFVIMIFFSLSDILIGLFNPEFGALEFILNKLSEL